MILSSCAGYQLNDYSNPLIKWDIKKLRLVSFYNETNFAGAGSAFLEETYKMLSQLHELELVSDNKMADGVLIGVVSSGQSKKESLRSSSKVVATTQAPTSTAGRQDFNITATNILTLTVTYYIVKDHKLAAYEQIKKIDSLGDTILNSQSVYSKKIQVTEQIRREIYDGEASAVNQTQNEKAVARKIRELGQDAAIQLKNALLYEI